MASQLQVNWLNTSYTQDQAYFYTDYQMQLVFDKWQDNPAIQGFLIYRKQTRQNITNSMPRFEIHNSGFPILALFTAVATRLQGTGY